MTLIKIEKVDEVYLRILTERSVDQELSEFFKFPIPNAKFMPMVKAGMSDGMLRLYNMNTKKLYSGLIKYVITFAERNDYTLEIDDAITYDNKISVEDVVGFTNLLKLSSKGNLIEIRDYQLEAIHKAVNENRTLLISPTSCLDPETIIEVELDNEHHSISLSNLESLVKNDKLPKINTPSGFERITDTYRKIGPGVELTFSDGSILKAANNHLIKKDDTQESWVECKDLMVGESFNNKTVTDIVNVDSQSWIDFSIDAPHESYYHDEILHHNSGKSLILYSLLRWHIANGRRVLILCPTTSLVVQLYADFEDYSSTNNWNVETNCQKLYSGFSKELTTNCMISTWQSIVPIMKANSTGSKSKYPKKNNKPVIEQSMKEFFSGFDAVFIDECLHPDSLIQTIDKKTQIKNIKVDDLVLTINEDTGAFEYNKVIKIHSNLSIHEQKYKLTFQDNSFLIITGNHKVQTYTGWKRTDDLSLSDIIYSNEMKWKRITSIDEIEYSGKVYNLHIENNHNYFANGTMVSNCHLSTGASLKTIMEHLPHAKYRVGTTGTVQDDQCLDSDSIITTSLGDKRIKDIEIGDDILSFNDKSNQVEFKRVIRKLNNGIPNNGIMLKIITDKYVLICTPEHRVYTENRGFIMAKDLLKTDILKSSQSPRPEGRSSG